MDVNILLLFVSSLFAALLPASLGIKCYVCSWSPKDASNRTDVCSAGHFKTNEVYVHQCNFGCEIYVSWDNNGVLEQSRRNCMDDGTPLTESCVNEENKAHSWKRCTCIGDLCNSARSNNNHIFWISTVVVLSILMQQIKGHVQ